MATWDITVPAGSGVAEAGSGSSAITEPGDFDGATITDVSVVGTPTITSDGTTDDTIGIRWRIQTDGGTAVWGDYGSDAVSACSASLGDSVSSDTITDGSAPNPAPSTAVAADWDEIAYSANYTANMMGDNETCSWSAFTLRVTYSVDITLTADGSQLTATGGTATAQVDLSAGSAALALTGGEATLYESVRLDAQPGALAATGGSATLAVDLAATSAALALTGGEATLFESVRLDAQPAALTASGATATLDFDLAAAAGSLTATGGTAGMATDLSATSAALALTGGDATLSETGSTSVTADGGTLTLTGGAATLEVVVAAVEQTSGGGADPSDVQIGPVEPISEDDVAMILQVIRAFLDKAA